MIGQLTGLASVFGLLQQGEDIKKELGPCIEKLEKVLEIKNPSMNDLENLVKEFQSVTSKMQSCLRKLKNATG